MNEWPVHGENVRMGKWMHLNVLCRYAYPFYKNLWRISCVPDSMTGTGAQREQDRPAPCLQEASILVRDIVHPQETNMSLISDERAMEEIHNFIGDRVSGGAGLLEGKGSREGLFEKVAFELWMTVRALVLKCLFSSFQELYSFFSAVLQGMWDLSSPIMDQTLIPWCGNAVLTTAFSGRSQKLYSWK